MDTGCSPEDLPEAMNDGENWRERVRDIRASCTTWWYYINIYIYIYIYIQKAWQQLHKNTASNIEQVLFGHQPPIIKTIQVIRTRHVGLCWKSGDGLISDILLWNPSHGWAKCQGDPCWRCDMMMMIYKQDVALNRPFHGYDSKLSDEDALALKI